MNRGDVWWAHIGAKRRPVVVLTRHEVIDVRELVTVAEVTTTVRGLAVEVPIDSPLPGLPKESVVNCDGLHTLRHSSLTAPAGALGDATMHAACRAVAYALGC